MLYGLRHPARNAAQPRPLAHETLRGSTRIVARTLEVIKYLEPRYWAMENPQTGKLKNQEVVSQLAFGDVDYCTCGFPYRKRTRLWNNIECWSPRSLCRRDCGSMTEDRTRHLETAQRGPSKVKGEMQGGRQSQRHPV